MTLYEVTDHSWYYVERKQILWEFWSDDDPNLHNLKTPYQQVLPPDAETVHLL